MWHKIKKLFKTQEELPVEEVEFASLNSWLEPKQKEKLESLNKELDNSRNSILEEIKLVRENIQILADAKLLNENIPERAKHYATGNREALIKKTEQLINSIIVPEKLDELGDFILTFNRNLMYFAESTNRPLKILDEFFAKESRAILAGIGKIGKEIDSQKNNFEIVKQINQINSNLDSINKNKEFHKKLESEKTEKEKEINEIKNELVLIKEELNVLNTSEAYLKYQDKKENLQALNAKIKQVKEEFEKPFSIIETALKKYSHITFEDTQIIDAYIKNPIDTFITDKNLRILKIIEDSKKAILTGQIELKDKKKIKIKNELENMTPSFFNTFTKAYGLMKKDEKDMIEQLMNAQIIKDIKEKQNDIENTKEKLGRSEKEFEILKSDLLKLGEEGNMTELESLISGVFKIKVEIKYSCF